MISSLRNSYDDTTQGNHNLLPGKTSLRHKNYFGSPLRTTETSCEWREADELSKRLSPLEDVTKWREDFALVCEVVMAAARDLG